MKNINKKMKLVRAALVLLLMLVTSTTAWATDPFGYVDVCTGHNGSIYLDLWALDPDDYNARTTIHVYLRQNGQDKYVYNLGPTDIYRADEPNPQYAGYHKMQRYISVPIAGTYDVYVYVINAAGDGTNPLCLHTWNGAPYPNYASVTTSSPYTVTYNANGGSGAPSAITKSYGINLTLSSTQPTRSGYQFAGWNTAADGSGTAYSSGATYTGNANVTFYAQWTQSGNNSVEMASGTQDASHWSFSSGTANFGNTITVNYNGSLNLESVTLRRKTTNTYELNSSNISTAVSNFNSQPGSRLVFTANISEAQTFTCSEGEIDMNGHSSSKDLFIQNNVLGKTITIKNGTVTGTDGAGGFNDYYNGTVVLENMTVTGRVWTDGHPYVINGGTYAEIINDKNADTPGTVIIYDGKFSQLGNWGSGGTFTLYGGKYAINPSSLSYCTIPSGCSVQSNTDSDSGTYPWVVRNTGLPVANPYSLAVTEVTANRQWTFTMPPYDVEVVANYALSYLAYNTATGGFDAHPVPNNITAVTSGPTTMNSGWYIVNSNVTISTRITVNGTVNLILADGYSLTASQGITVNSGNTLNIYGQSGGTGTLNATGAKLSSNDGTEAAGIGSTGYSAVGNITIHGGRITATGADWSAGIGGGVRGGGGSVTIYGGTTLATAGEPTYGDQDAIGSGASGANGTKTLADGLRVTTYNNTTPYAYGNRVNAFYEKVVKVEPCTSHNLSNNVCTYCGLTIYTVTYNVNNATSGTVPAPSTEYQPGETVTILGNTGNLVRTGYTYSGWNTAANGSGTDYVAGTSFAINNSLTLYAKWTSIEYTITCDLDGGTVATANPTTYTAESDAITLTNPTRDGYAFAGWTGTGLTEPTKTVTIPAGSTGNRTYTATWAEIFTITYDLDGGTVATANPTTYTALSDNITLNNPTRDSYAFAGWTGTDLTEPTMTVTIPKGSTGDRSYTATWIGITGSYLAYNTTTGGFEMRMAPDNIASVTSSTTTMGADNTVTWYIVDNIVSVSDRITVNGTVHLILADGTTLTASKGITVNSGNTLNIYGQTSGIGALNATGAKLGGDGTEAAGIGSTNNSTVGNITIHGGRITANSAGWTAGIGGGIRGGGGSITIYGGTINATGHGSTSEGIGHGADGANVTKNLAEGLCVIVNNYSIPVAYGDRVSSLSQLVVRVEPCTEHNLSNNVCTYCGLSYYGVTYNGNNATGGTVPASAYYTTGQTVTVTVSGNTGNLVRTGYTFAGWNTAADGSGTDYAADATFTISSSVTLYAKWTPITYTVRFIKNHNYASGTMDDQSFTYAVAQPLTANGFTAPAGISFVGWSITPNGYVVYTDGQSVNNLATVQDAVVNLYAQYAITLANNADNDDAISVANGERHDVTLADRTLYHDGDWNTLCLPFALASFSGTPLEGATVKTLESTDFNDGTLTMTFTDNLTSIEAGKPYIVKWTEEAMSELDADLVIRSVADWNTFVSNVTGGMESYQGKVVKLAADISVSTMVGEDGNEFKGTFDGCGHTLTFNYTTDADNAAPFQWIKNAVIRNLTVMGEITSSKMFAAGFVARAHGDNAIESCVSSVTIHASKNGDGTHGGFVGRIESDCSTFTFTDCKFKGTFDGSDTDNWCPFAAWSMGNDNTHFTFNHCLCAPASANVRSGNATFYRNGTPTLNGAYYTQAIGTAQGINASGMSNETLASNLGDGWEISGGNVVPKTKPSNIVIRSAAEWNTFADNVRGGNSYQGMTVKLAADISVSTTTGDTSFRGTFDGCGHTLNINFSSSDAFAAPFSHVNGATIKNLIVTGTVNGAIHCSGLVGGMTGSPNLIENCDVRVAITCSSSHCGGFIGHASGSINTIRNCRFSGSITGGSAAVGIFQGWAGVNNSLINCLAAGTYTNCVDLRLAYGDNNTINNCYKKQNFGTQGTYTTATGSDLQALLGSGWEVRDGNVVPKMVNTVSDFENPVFTNVTISDATANVSTQYVDFVGTYSPVTYSDENRSVLFLGGGSKLYYPDGTSSITINACRAFFQLKDITAGDPADPSSPVKAFVLNFGEDDPDGIGEIKNEKLKMNNEGEIYNLAGQRVTPPRGGDGRGLQRGIYILNGRKVLK